MGLDKLSAQEIVELMTTEEAAVLDALASVAKELGIAAQKAADAFQAGGRIIYIGAGTSGRIATLDAAEMPPTFGIEPGRFVALMAGGTGANSRAVEGSEDDEAAGVADLGALSPALTDIVIGLAASGRTPYVRAAVRHARSLGIWACGIANNPGSPLLFEADLGILLDTGPEVLTGSTRLKAGTAQKLALNRISTAAMVLCGKTISNLMVDVTAKNQKLRERCVRIVRELVAVSEEAAWSALEESRWSVRGAVEALSR